MKQTKEEILKQFMPNGSINFKSYKEEKEAILSAMEAYATSVQVGGEGRGFKKHFKLPFVFDGESTHILDSDGNMVAEVRGWGHLSNKFHSDEAEAIQCEIGRFLCAALNVESPTEQPTGWEEAFKERFFLKHHKSFSNSIIEWIKANVLQSHV